MLSHSNELAETVQQRSQYVEPYVLARFGDNRFIENLYVETSNDYYEEAVSRLAPSLYWRFYGEDYIANNVSDNVNDLSGNKFSGKIYGTAISPAQSVISNKIVRYSQPADNFQKISESEFEALPVNTYVIKNIEYPYIPNFVGNRWSIVDKKDASANRVSFMTISRGIEDILDYNLIESGGNDGVLSFSFLTDPAPVIGQGALIRYEDDDNYILVIVETWSPSKTLRVKEKVDGSFVTNQVITPPVGAAAFQNLTIEFIGNELTIVYTDLAGPDEYSHITLARGTTSPARATKHGLAALNIGSQSAEFLPVNIGWTNFALETYQSKDFSIKRGNNTGYIKSKFAEIDLTDEFTISCFIKAEALPGAGEQSVFFEVLDDDSPQNILHQLFVDEDGYLGVKLPYLSGVDILQETFTATTQAISIDQWYMITLTVDGSQVYLYIDDETTPCIDIDDFTNTIYSTSTVSIVAFSTLSEEDDDNTLLGYIDELFIVNNVLNQSSIAKLFATSLNDNVNIDSWKNYFSNLDIFDVLDEEMFAWTIFDDTAVDNKKIFANGYFNLLSNNKEKLKYSFISKNKSAITAVNDVYPFEKYPYIYATFNSLKINKIKISTGYDMSRVADFEIKVNGNAIPGHSLGHSIAPDQSYLIINFESEVEATSLEFTIKSSHTPESYGRIYGISLMYEVDISEDVISLDFNKLREDYESTLPLGTTTSNNGSMTLNNTHQKYNPYNAQSPYVDFLEPETRMTLGLKYRLAEDEYETVILATNVLAESWSISSDSMTAEVGVADWSKVLQEITAEEGFLFEDVVAGRAISQVARESGVPTRSVNYWDSYYQTVIKDKPVSYWRVTEVSDFLPETSAEETGFGGRVVDECGYNDMKYFINIDTYPMTSDLMPRAVTLGVQPVLLQERTIGIDVENRTLASLYGITASYLDLPEENVYKPIYAIRGLSGDEYGDGYFYLYSDATTLSDLSQFSLDCTINVDVGSFANNDEAIIVCKEKDGEPLFSLSLERVSDQYIVKSYIKGQSIDTEIESIPVDANNFEGKAVYVNFTKNNENIILYVNSADFSQQTGYTESVEDEIAGEIEAAGDGATDYFSIYKSVSGEELTFNGKISNVAVYDYALSESQILKHYLSSQLEKIQIFPYLYFFETSYWDGMLEIATADVGMFYFDEFNTFYYEYKNTFHDIVFDRFQNIQYNLSDNVNIINGSHIVDIQTNKIKVIVNPKTKISTDVSSIWRAQQNDSLAVTKLKNNIGVNDVSILVDNTENPIWPINGYIKIDNEIIEYKTRDVNRFFNITRGVLGTTADAHDEEALVREVKVYDIEFSEKPVSSVRTPFITAQIFEGRADIDQFVTTPLSARLVVSASDTIRNNPSDPEKNLVILEGENPLTGKGYALSVAGMPLTETSSSEKTIEELRQIDTSLRKFRPKELTVDNKFIQQKAYAQEIADYILKFYGYPVPIIELSIIGVPFLQLGDLVNIVSFEELNIENEKYWVIESNTQYNGGVQQTLKLKRYVEELA